ncbi:hypothetical protein [Longispora urticae]
MATAPQPRDPATGRFLPRPPIPPAPAGRLGALSRLTMGNWAAIAGALLLLAGSIILDQYDDKAALDAATNWAKAADYMGPDDHGSIVQQLNDWEGQHLPEDVWTAADRGAFDDFIRNLKNESAAMRTAFLRNGMEIERVRAMFQDSIDTLSVITIPAMIIAIVAIPMQYFPPTIALATALGIASSTITYSAWGIIITALLAFLAQIGVTMSNDTTSGFSVNTKAVDTRTDRDFKDIKITWTHDPDFYMKKPA